MTGLSLFQSLQPSEIHKEWSVTGKYILPRLATIRLISLHLVSNQGPIPFKVSAQGTILNQGSKLAQ